MGRYNENIRADLYAPLIHWKNIDYAPLPQNGWVNVEERYPLIQPIPKRTLPIGVRKNIAPFVVQEIGTNHYFFDFGYDTASGIMLFVPHSKKLKDQFYVEIKLAEQANYTSGDPRIIYPCHSGNKYIFVCKLSNVMDSLIEHHEYPGNWR